METYVGEIRAFAFGAIPKGWAPCEGQILSAMQYSSLYSLIGNTYGGEASKTFALPDLRGRVPVGVNSATGSEYPLGKMGGAAMVALTMENLPAHRHDLKTASAAASNSVRNTVYSRTPGKPLYAEFGSTVFGIDPGMIDETGKGEPHDNLQPSLVVRYCIALVGIYPRQR